MIDKGMTPEGEVASHALGSPWNTEWYRRAQARGRLGPLTRARRQHGYQFSAAVRHPVHIS